LTQSVKSQNAVGLNKCWIETNNCISRIIFSYLLLSLNKHSPKWHVKQCNPRFFILQLTWTDFFLSKWDANHGNPVKLYQDGSGIQYR